MDFYRRSGGGFMSVCKACHRVNVKANREARAEQYREYERHRANLPHRVAMREQYATTPRGRERSNAAKRRYLERNPVKRAAHIAVSNALRDGQMHRSPCEVCGNPKAEAHHDDYSKPLDVRWLCREHHAEWHRNNTPKCPEQEKAA